MTEVQRVSVVIPVYNAIEHLGDLLSELAKQDFQGDWEIVVADNGSTDGSSEEVERRRPELPPLRFVDASAQRGAAYARNVGVAHANGDLLLFCDADDLVSRGWVRHMAEAANGGAGLLLCSDDVLDNQGAWKPPRKRIDWDSFSFLPWGRGTCIGTTKEAFDRVHGFDTYLLAGEDVDFCWRVQLAGFRCELVPGAVAYYRLRENSRALLRQQFRFGRATVLLHKRFRPDGKPRPRLRQVARGYAWSLTRLPFLLSSRRRHIWIILTMQRLGRLWGTVRYRVWYP